MLLMLLYIVIRFEYFALLFYYIVLASYGLAGLLGRPLVFFGNFATYETQLSDKNSALGPKHNVPIYMWDIYRNGISNSRDLSKVEVVKGIIPKFFGPFFRNQIYLNHGKQIVEFNVPEATFGETLIDAEIRVMTKEIRKLNVSFQIFHKDTNWVFLDAKAVPPVGVDWISLNVTPSVKEFEASSVKIAFLIICAFRNPIGKIKRFQLMKDLQPVLLLSYASAKKPYVDNEFRKNLNGTEVHLGERKSKSEITRRKRDLLEEYEEETNRIWEGDTRDNRQKLRNTCRRKPLYIEFSDIDYDTWIVAPTGYEAFQCVGKCTLPLSEHLTPTKHAIIQTLAHHVSPEKAGRVCCVPTKLDPISILYVDSRGILTYRFRYQEMVVAECGCR